MNGYRFAGALLVLSGCVLTALPASAHSKGARVLTEVEQRSLMSALLADPQMPMSEDPSCKSDLSKPGRVSVSQALAAALARAAAEKPPRVVQVDCFQRRGYPRTAGQEYCELAFVPSGKRKEVGFGLSFLMDWSKKLVVAESAECF